MDHKCAEARTLVYHTFWSHEPFGCKFMKSQEVHDLTKVGGADYVIGHGQMTDLSTLNMSTNYEVDRMFVSGDIAD